jgi:hypothetical protein
MKLYLLLHFFLKYQTILKERSIYGSYYDFCLMSCTNDTLQLGAWSFVQRHILQVPTISLSIAAYNMTVRENLRNGL